MERIEVYKAYFFDDTSYYAKVFEEHEQGKKFTFNFSAGFFGVCWFLYRKMYLEGFIIWIILVLLGFIIDSIVASFGIINHGLNSMLSNLISLPISFLTLSFLGNYFYIRKSQRIVETFLSTHNLEQLESKDIAKLGLKGGTSYFAAFSPLILIFVLVVLYFITIR